MLVELTEKTELQVKVEILYQDILTSSFDGNFDLILSAMALQHIENTTKIIQRFAENLM